MLLRVRPQIARQQERMEAMKCLRVIVETEGGEVKTGAAPPGPVVRQLDARGGD